MTPLRLGNGGVHLSVGGKTDVGRQRDNNEDRFLLARLGPAVSEETPQMNGELVGPKGYLLAVADGMGGAAAGELASEMATDVVVQSLLNGWAREAKSSARAFASHLDQAISDANVQIHRRATDQPEFHGMGSTFTAVGVLGSELIFAQVGDSRAYLVRKGEAVQVTEDQSLVRHLIEEGQITEEEAKRSPGVNLILQALGPRPTVEPDLTIKRARRGDTIVLCTDGLSGVVTTAEICDAVHRSHDPETVCDDLIELANSRGGPDNVTVVVGRLDGPGLSKPSRWD